MLSTASLTISHPADANSLIWSRVEAASLVSVLHIDCTEIGASPPGKANKDVPYAFTLLFKLASTLGFTFEKATLSEEELNAKLAEISTELGENYSSMEEIIEKRKIARAEKNWEAADKIRVALDKVGIVLKDSKDGTIWELK